MRLIIILFGKRKSISTSIINKSKNFNKNQGHNFQFQKVKTNKEKDINNDLDTNEFFQKFMKENYDGNV